MPLPHRPTGAILAAAVATFAVACGANDVPGTQTNESSVTTERPVQRTEVPTGETPSSVEPSEGDTAQDRDPAQRPPDEGAPPFAWPSSEPTRPNLSDATAERGRPRGDASRAERRTAGWYALSAPREPAPGRGETAARVVEVRRATREEAADGVVRLEARDGSTIDLPLSGRRVPPIQAGDEVGVRWERRRLGFHRVEAIGLIDAAGRVVYASSGSGDPRYAPGWYIEVGDVRTRGEPHTTGGARRERRWLLVARGDAVAFVAEDEPGARLLTTSDGTYAVWGHATSWTPGVLPPEASTYEAYTIRRVE